MQHANSTPNNTYDNGGKRPIYKRWYFWLILILVIDCICINAGFGKDDAESDDAAYDEPTAIVETEAAEEPEQSATIDGTDASEYFETLYATMTEINYQDAPEPTVKGDTAIYKASTEYHTLKVTADAQTDEIMAVTLNTLSYSDDVSTYNLLLAAINSSGVAGLDKAAALDWLLEYFGGDANDKQVSGKASDSLGTDSALYSIKANKASLPKLAIAAAQ